jgi:hypothetical protein
MTPLFSKIVFGESVIREYSTVRIGETIREKVYLRSSSDGPVVDVSRHHWVLCLDPLVFGVWIDQILENAFDERAFYQMFFRDTICAPGDDPGKGALASVQLIPVDKIVETGGSLFLFRLQSCAVHHISALRTRLLYWKYYRKPGLSFAKLKSFAAAYSYPRRVRIVSFRGDDYYNIFPMDLLGECPQAGRYVFGLRHTNLALARILAAGKIVVSEIPFGYKETIYKLGSHHSAQPPAIGDLPFATVPSPQFAFPIPVWAENCREIRILRTINLGSHMLMWGEPIGEAILNPVTDHLHHIHFLLYLHQRDKGIEYPPA